MHLLWEDHIESLREWSLKEQIGSSYKGSSDPENDGKVSLKSLQQEQLENYFLKYRHLDYMITGNNSLTWWGEDQGY